MKNKTVKKTLACLFAAAMVASALPISALAESWPVEGYGNLTGTIEFVLGLSSVRYKTEVTTNPDSAYLGHGGTLYYNNGNANEVYSMRNTSPNRGMVGFITLQDASGFYNVTKVESTHQVFGGLTYSAFSRDMITYYQ